MNSVSFKMMNQEDFNIFKEKSIKEYAIDQIKSKEYDEITAYKFAKDEFENELPNGLDTKNNYICTILNGINENIGFIWYQKNCSEWFLADLFIIKEQRRKGYGKQTMVLLELLAKNSGMKKIKLHVFGYNVNAIKLYKKVGYKTDGSLMSKVIIK